jgi:hypothetical protein
MKVYLYEYAHTGDPPKLGLHAETDYDRMLLEKLEERYQLVGMGRDYPSMQVGHAELELKPKFAETAASR